MIKYWTPIKETYDYLQKIIPKNARVLELGPGIVPVPFATHFCGWLDSEKKKLNNYKTVDFCEDIFPYEDKEFDFVYARHVLEDLYNPFHCIKEMSRIAKAGYIECPSLLAEMNYESENWVEGVTEKWRGYNHHHFMVWNNGTLNFLHKFPAVEYITFPFQNKIEEILENPIQWNSYYYWEDKINYKHHQHPADYFAPGNEAYAALIKDALNDTLVNNNTWIKNFLHEKLPREVSK